MWCSSTRLSMICDLPLESCMFPLLITESCLQGFLELLHQGIHGKDFLGVLPCPFSFFSLVLPRGAWSHSIWEGEAKLLNKKQQNWRSYWLLNTVGLSMLDQSWVWLGSNGPRPGPWVLGWIWLIILSPFCGSPFWLHHLTYVGPIFVWSNSKFFFFFLGNVNSFNSYNLPPYVYGVSNITQLGVLCYSPLVWSCLKSIIVFSRYYYASSKCHSSWSEI